MPSPSPVRQTDTPSYRTVDIRAMVRCSVCGSWLQSGDRVQHTRFHAYLVYLDRKLASFVNPSLFDSGESDDQEPQTSPPPF